MEQELAYSFHLGSDKNKSKVAKKTAKGNVSGTTSLSNNAIQNANDLSRANKHNLRDYDNQRELITTIYGTNDIVEDVKQVYIDEFEESRIEFNNKQTRNDRKINNYFEKACTLQNDIACEIIIELGDMDFWQDKDDEYRFKMIDVYNEQIQDLNKIVPNFKIANATIHFDESSPHLHIVGVPFKDGMKNGMEKQVGKSDVFTKISLVNIQDKMREYCISSFNRIYNLNYSLKDKEEGRNIDINVSNMKDYNKFRKEQEKHKKQLKELNDKANQLQNKSNEINDIINNLKPTIMNKNNYTISNDDIDKIKKYIEQTNDTTSNLKDSNDINVILNKYEQNLKNHSNEVKELKKKITTREDRISDLENRLDFANDTIDMLEDKVSKLEKTLDYFKELWNKFVKFLQDKFFSTNEYDDIIDELYEEEILDNDDMDTIKNEYSKDDDLER